MKKAIEKLNILKNQIKIKKKLIKLTIYPLNVSFKTRKIIFFNQVNRSSPKYIV